MAPGIPTTPSGFFLWSPTPPLFRMKCTSGIYLFINKTFELAEHSTEVGLRLKFRDALILVGISGCTGKITREAIKSRFPLIILIALITWTWWNSATSNNKSCAFCWRLYRGNYTLACCIEYMRSLCVTPVFGKVNVKVKIFTVHTMKPYRNSRAIAPLSPNLYPLHRRLSGSQIRCEHCGVGKYHLSLSGFWPQIVWPVA